MSTMTAQQATIDTLTAQVRTLVVGTRQITLSVANQLDTVDLESLTVMGRVSLRRDGHYVIGADPDGNLALATYKSYVAKETPEIWVGELPGKVTVCRSTRPTGYPQVYNLAIDGIRFSLEEHAAEKCDRPDHGYYRAGVKKETCDGWVADREVQDRIRDAINRWQANERNEIALNKAAAEAPLLVLAGLR